MKPIPLKSNYRISLLSTIPDSDSPNNYNEIALRNAMIGLKHCIDNNLLPYKLFYINKIAYLYRQSGNYSKSLVFYKQKHQLAKLQLNEKDIVDALYWQAVMYERTGHTQKAIKFLFEALEYDQKDYKVKIYNCLAVLYSNLEKHKDAFRYVEKALTLSKYLIVYDDILDTYLLASESCFRNNEMLKANAYLEKAQSIAVNKGIFKKRGNIYYLKGRILAFQGKHKAALENLKKAKKQLRINKIWHTFIHCNIVLAQVFEAIKELNDAIDTLKDVLPKVKEINLVQEHLDICFYLQSYYKKLGTTDKAYDFLSQAYALKEELHKRQAGWSRNRLEDKFAHEIELLSKDLEHSNHENVVLKEEIEQMKSNFTDLESEKQDADNAIKSFAGNLSLPVNQIYRLAQVMYRKRDEKVEVSKENALKTFLNKTHQLNEYFSHLNLYANVHRATEEEQPTLFTVKQLIKEIATDFRIFPNEEVNLQIIYNNEIPEIWVNEEHFRLLISHLIFNALTLMALRPPFLVEINIQETGQMYAFEIAEMRMVNVLNDNQEENIELPKIFDLLKILDFVAAEGNSASLALCQKIVKLYKGEIWARYVKHQGFVFSFSVPKKELGEAEIPEKNQSSTADDVMLNQMRVRYRTPPQWKTET